VVRVRVLGSKKRLATVRPRSSGTFFDRAVADRREALGVIENLGQECAGQAFDRDEMTETALRV